MGSTTSAVLDICIGDSCMLSSSLVPKISVRAPSSARWVKASVYAFIVSVSSVSMAMGGHFGNS